MDKSKEENAVSLEITEINKFLDDAIKNRELNSLPAEFLKIRGDIVSLKIEEENMYRYDHHSYRDNHRYNRDIMYMKLDAIHERRRRLQEDLEPFFKDNPSWRKWIN